MPTLTEIRNLVASKVSQHRMLIIEQLKTYGVNRVSLLPEQHYLDFYKFLTSLN